jgi:hypothetical protein
MILLPLAVLLLAFVVALAMLHSVSRAFVLSSAFTVGVLGGSFVGLILARLWTIATAAARPVTPNPALYELAIVGGAIAGAVLALYALNKVSKYPPWRRY